MQTAISFIVVIYVYFLKPFCCSADLDLYCVNCNKFYCSYLLIFFFVSSTDGFIFLYCTENVQHLEDVHHHPLLSDYHFPKREDLRLVLATIEPHQWKSSVLRSEMPGQFLLCNYHRGLELGIWRNSSVLWVK